MKDEKCKIAVRLIIVDRLFPVAPCCDNISSNRSNRLCGQPSI
jgi:hypothetical protein